MFTRIPVLAALSVFATAVVAVPAATSSVPEVIPGPGLPSLESLNLTSADLYAMGPPPAASEYLLLVGARSADYTAVCQTYSTAAVNDVIACFNYLVSIGNNACAVTNPDLITWFCESGTAAISGSNTSGQPTVSSTCYDVALGLQWVFTYCNVDGQVGGSQAANGNGGLIVAADNISWM
ncbi:hypothetical protein OG21DRAFT_1407725 [Imleria badia]|nr:hypothetical protein OG21DRAFT_1407725 [Imleria badia]